MDTITAVRQMSLYEQLISGEPQRPLTRVRHARGKLLFQPGDEGEALYLIHEGYVRSYRLSPEGREVTFGLLGAGEVLGELALVSGERHTSFAEVMDDTELSILPRPAFEAMLRQDPQLAYSLMVRISERLRYAEDLVEDLVNRDVASRVARTLLNLADSFGRIAPSGVMIDLRLPYQEIANMVGSTRETVTRALSQMQQNNWVRLEGGRLHLIDQEALALLST